MMTDFGKWFNEVCTKEGGLAPFLRIIDVEIPYRTALKWKSGKNNPPEWAQNLLQKSYEAILFRKMRLEYLQTVLDSTEIVTYPCALEILQMANMVEPFGISLKMQFNIEHYFHEACIKLGLDDSRVKVI